MKTQLRANKNEVINLAYLEYIQNPTEETLTRLLKVSIPLVRHFSSYFSGGFYQEDMIQSGFEGILKAVKNYNGQLGSSFATYAGHCIIGEVRHYIRKEMRYYKPGFLSSLQEKAQGLTEKYYEENGDIPPKSLLAKGLNIKEEGVDEILKAGLVSFESLELDRIICQKYESFKLPIEDKIILYEAFQKLSKLKQYIVYSLFFQNRTQQQTANSLGINQRKVSRLLKSSLDDLRYSMTE